MTGVRTFQQCFEEFFPPYAGRKKLRQSGRTAWTQLIARNPALMGKPVVDVTEDDILAVVKTVSKNDEKKRKAFNQFRKICRWARAQGHIPHNPIDYMLDDKLELEQIDKDKHLPSLPWQEVPAFWAELKRNESLASLTLQWIILTAVRSGEGRGARFDEIFSTRDPLDGKPKSTWCITAPRMKEDEPHAVPLSRQAVEVFEKIKSLGHANGELLFPAPRAEGKCIGFNAVLALRPPEVSVHGFRSSFATWANEHGWPIPLIDCSLAHVIAGPLTRVYVRGTLTPERRPLMQAWADFLDSGFGVDHDQHVHTFRLWEKALKAEFAAATSPVVSKSEFAAMVGLSRATFSMMLKRGAVGGAAIVGVGQKAKINIEIAKYQLTQKIGTRVVSRVLTS